MHLKLFIIHPCGDDWCDFVGDSNVIDEAMKIH